MRRLVPMMAGAFVLGAICLDAANPPGNSPEKNSQTNRPLPGGTFAPGRMNATLYVSPDQAKPVVTELLALKKSRESDLAKVYTNGFVLLRTRGREFSSVPSDTRRIRFNADWSLTRILVDPAGKNAQVLLPAIQIGFENSWLPLVYRKTVVLSLKENAEASISGPASRYGRFTMVTVMIDPDPNHLAVLVAAVLEPSGKGPSGRARRSGE